MPEPLLLAFDTSGPHCTAALMRKDAVIAHAFEDLQKGQAERLMPMLEALLERADSDWQRLSAIAVGIGPGNFTGTRISVAAARGLALGLGVPTLGISNFEIMREARPEQVQIGHELVSLQAPRQSAYLQMFLDGSAEGAPVQIDPESTPETLFRPNLRITGHRAHDIARTLGGDAYEAELSDIAPRIGKIAYGRLLSMKQATERPAPLYVRPADAVPSRDMGPVILP